MSKLKKQVTEIIKQLQPTFPKARRIVVLARNGDYYMYVQNLIFFSVMAVDKACKKIPTSGLVALVAHELAHIQYPHLDERAIDLKLLELGFRENLIAFHEWHNRKYRKYKKKDGLTLNEIHAFK